MKKNAGWRSYRNNLLVIPVFFGFVFTSCVIIFSSEKVFAASDATLTLTTTPQTVNQGNTFDLVLTENSATNSDIKSVDMFIQFDSAVLQLNSIDNNATAFNTEMAENIPPTTTAGTANYNATRMGGVALVGSQIVATLHFTAIGVGSSSVSFATGTAVWDGSNGKVTNPAGLTGASITVTASGGTPPTLTQITAIPSPTNDATPSYTFSSNVVGTVTYPNPSCVGDLSTVAIGNNAVTFNTLADGAYTCSIRVAETATPTNFNTIVANNNAGVSSPFIIDTTAPVVAQVTAVSTPRNNTTPSYTFSSSEAGTLSVGGSCTSATTTATSGNNTISFSTLTPGTYSNCTITVTDAATNASNILAVSSFTIDTTAPVVAQVTAVPTPRNNATPSYTFSSTEAGTVSYGGDCSGTTGGAVSSGNTTVTFATLAAGTHSNCTVTVTDSATNASNVLAVSSFTIDTTAPVVAQVTAVPTPTNNSTPSYTFSSTKAGTITYGGSCSSSTTNAISGNNTITFGVLSNGTYSNCTVRVTDSATNASNILAVSTFVIDATAPTIAQVTAVTTPTSDTTPEYIFSSTEAGTITYGGSCSSSTTTAISGNNTISFNALAEGTYSNCTIRVTDAATNASNLITVSSFTIDPAPVISAVLPTGTLAIGTTQATVTFTTNESGICRYAPVSGIAFASMTNIIDTVLATSHAFTVTDLVNGGTYSYWVRCQDSASMVNLADTLISFSVASPAPVVTSSSHHSSSSKKSSSTSPRTVSVSKKSVKIGEVLIQRGKKFSKNSFVLLYFQKAGGGYYAPQKVKTSATGGFVVTYKVNKAKGKYGWYVFDIKANKKSKTSYYTVK